MRTKLIIDSGSTKSDWRIVNANRRIVLSFPGINPAMKEWPDILNHNINEPMLHEVEDVYYYGAGVSEEGDRNYIIEKISPHLPQSCKYHIFSDMLGAARATAGQKNAIVAILGTGSNSCLYINGKIEKNIPSLGYLIGNEGGGTSIGKDMIRDFFYRRMPNELMKILEEKLDMSKQNVIRAMYHQGHNLHYIANFTKYLQEIEDSEYKSNLLKRNFNTFAAMLSAFYPVDNYPIYFVGSIAFHFKEYLKESFANYQMEITKILQKPIDGLVRYHQLEK